MLKAGEMIGDWVVDRSLGQGGMGSVYRCHNREAVRILAAVKVLDSSLQKQDHAKQRFVREAEILYQLEHPNIVKVRNIRMSTDTPHIEMEFVEGEDLESRMMRKGAMPMTEALPIFTQVADAMAYLHERGVRHRDIKPSNLVLQANGQVKLVDFGIALESGANPLTVAGMTFGSLGYVPPEWMDSKLDHVKWDIYSAGVLFWELLTGSQAWPVLSGGQQEMIRILTEKAKKSYLDIGEDHPTRLRALIADMTMSDRTRRLGAASDVRARLDAITAPVQSARPAPAMVSVPPARDQRPDPAEAPRTGVRVTTRLPDRADRPRLTPPPTPPAHLRSVTPELRSGDRSGSGRPHSREHIPTDPSYRVRESRGGTVLDVSWASSEIFAEWCARQLENYTMFLSPGAEPLPTAGTLRVCLWHRSGDDVIEIDCPARVQSASQLGIAYRLELEPLQQDRLHRWRTAWERRRR